MTTTPPPSAATPASESRLLAGTAISSNGSLHANGNNGMPANNGHHASLSDTRPTTTSSPVSNGSTAATSAQPAETQPRPKPTAEAGSGHGPSTPNGNGVHVNGHAPLTSAPSVPLTQRPKEESVETTAAEDKGGVREAFLRQLQLDRLTMRQMRGWLMADEARRAAEVAASATEATYERLALALFGVDLPQMLGRAAAVPPSTTMSAEERLELQREKARIRARQRRAAIKAARLAKEE